MRDDPVMVERENCAQLALTLLLSMSTASVVGGYLPVQVAVAKRENDPTPLIAIHFAGDGAAMSLETATEFLRAYRIIAGPSPSAEVAEVHAIVAEAIAAGTAERSGVDPDQLALFMAEPAGSA